MRTFNNARKDKPNISGLVYGKVPPQATEMEEAVLGACMLEREAIDRVMTFIKSADYFYIDANQKIWQAILNLIKSGDVVDLLTVTEQLRKQNELELIGGAYHITKLTMSVVSSAHVESHAALVAEKYMSRELIRISGSLIQEAYDESTDVFDLIDGAAKSISDLQVGSITSMPKNAMMLAKEHSTHTSNLQTLSTEFSGVPTMFPTLDAITFGWQKSDLIILAARPAVGKTAFTINLALNAAMSGYPTALFSLEMSTLQITGRALSNMSNGEMWKLIRPRSLGQNDMQDYMSANARFATLPIFIDDQPSMTVFELRAKARRLKQKHDIQFILIDYLQLMKGEVSKNGNREQEISSISRDLKALAKELEVPIIALSQLSRAVESRAVKIPTLADLRESGAIEQDADMVMFLYRPEYYGADAMGDSPEGLTELHIAKFRNGESGANSKVEFIFEKEYQRFKDRSQIMPPELAQHLNPQAGIKPNYNTFNRKDWE